MVIVVILLGVILFAAGGGALVTSVDLLPTEMGMLYAACGAIAISSAFIVFSIAALIRRVDALGQPSRPRRPEPAREEPLIDVTPAEEPTSAPSIDDPVRAEPLADEAVNENRSGRLPTLHEVEHAIAHPEAPPTLVGRYSAGGANYMIFSDGTIEAETEQGAYRFASLGEFKAFIAGRPD